MRKVSALFLAVAMAASVNVQAASFWDWLNGWGGNAQTRDGEDCLRERFR